MTLFSLAPGSLLDPPLGDSGAFFDFRWNMNDMLEEAMRDLIKKHEKHLSSPAKTPHPHK
jgi:hypothetical protein